MLAWTWLARYEWIVLSGGGEHSNSAEFALRLRYNAPHSRILMVGDADGPLDGLGELGVDVNMLIGRFAQEPAPSPQLRFPESAAHTGFRPMMRATRVMRRRQEVRVEHDATHD